MAEVSNRALYRARAALLVAALALSAASPALALDTPRPVDPADPQMRTQPYSPSARTLLPLTEGRSAMVTFGAEEGVKRVVVGTEGVLALPTAQEVQAAPIGNNLPVWAEKPGRTTLQVVTARPGRPDRVYHFLAVVRPAPAGAGAEDPETLTGLAFTYPEDEREKARAEAEARAAEARARAEATRARREHAVAAARLRQDFSCLNGLYKARGDWGIVPNDVCDDGQSIGLLYRGQRPVPSVFLVERDGSERAVRFDMRGDWMVVPVLRERLVLRLGDAVAEVGNFAPDPSGRDPGTGTTSPDVVREVVRAGRGAR